MGAPSPPALPGTHPPQANVSTAAQKNAPRWLNHRAHGFPPDDKLAVRKVLSGAGRLESQADRLPELGADPKQVQVSGSSPECCDLLEHEPCQASLRPADC